MLDKVIMTKEKGGGWYIESVDGRHFSTGKTKKEAKENYAKTLFLTLQAHMKKYGTISHLIKEEK